MSSRDEAKYTACCDEMRDAVDLLLAHEGLPTPMFLSLSRAVVRKRASIIVLWVKGTLAYGEGRCLHCKTRLDAARREMLTRLATIQTDPV